MWPISLGQYTSCVIVLKHFYYKGSDGLMNKVSVSQPRDHGFEPHTGHDHDSSYATSIGWFQKADSREINISC